MSASEETRHSHMFYNNFVSSSCWRLPAPRFHILSPALPALPFMLLRGCVCVCVCVENAPGAPLITPRRGRTNPRRSGRRMEERWRLSVLFETEHQHTFKVMKTWPKYSSWLCVLGVNHLSSELFVHSFWIEVYRNRKKPPLSTISHHFFELSSWEITQNWKLDYMSIKKPKFQSILFRFRFKCIWVKTSHLESGTDLFRNPRLLASDLIHSLPWN